MKEDKLTSKIVRKTKKLYIQKLLVNYVGGISSASEASQNNTKLTFVNNFNKKCTLNVIGDNHAQSLVLLQ